MNKVALVTGSAKGIGRAIVEKLASDGYDVVINYLSSSDAALKLKDEIIEKYSVKCLAIKCDVSKVDEFIDDWGLLLDCESKPGIYCITVDRKIVYIGKTILEI